MKGKVRIAGPLPSAIPFLASAITRLMETYSELVVELDLSYHLKDGRLVRIMSSFRSRTIPIQAVRFPSEFKNPKVAAFTECMQETLQ